MKQNRLVFAGVLCASAAVGSPTDCMTKDSGGEGIRPCAMRVMSLGSIRPEGHLRERLELQAKGLTGHAEELYDDIGHSDWLTNAGRGDQYSWERGPYYARGLIALAFTLGDDGLKEKARKWVEAALASQKKSGDIGPRKDNWWANMIPQWYLRDWADVTGDPRVVPFLERYYAYQEKEFETVPLEKEGCWACARGGDEIDAILWLYGKIGDKKWIDFARRIAAMTADWTTYYRVGGDPGSNAPGCGGYRCHIVNFMQGLKFPAMKWLLGGDEADRNAYAAAFDPKGWVMRTCGRPDGMINGSEPLTDRSASGGTELCAIAERIISIQKTVAVFGDAAPADDLEDVAYNSLAATVTKDMKGIRYYLLLNQPMCVDKGLMFANNGIYGQVTGANCPGPHSGFGCCRSNWHVAWPKFVQTMWMLKDDGIAAVAHGPSSVTAKLPCGEVTLREETDYPRSGKVTVRVVKGGGKFPLFVRIPRWAKVPDAGTFRKYEREWKVGDAIEIDFPMDISLSYWANGAVAVRRGPFLYSLKIDEEWKKVERYKVPYENAWVEKGGGDFPRWEIRPKSPWNYALVLKDGVLKDAEVLADGVEIRVKAVRTEAAGWGYMRADAPGRAVDPPLSPVDRCVCSGEETVTLVPLGMTQIRITLLPWVKTVKSEEKAKEGMSMLTKSHVWDEITCCGRYAMLHPRFGKAFEFLKQPDLASLPVGRYEIETNNCWAVVQSCELTPFGDIQHPEVHRDFIDIQAPLDGPETYGLYDAKGKLFEPFDAEKDIGFTNAKTEPLTLRPGEFAIFFPSDGGHAPCKTMGSKTMRKKLVIKVRK